MALSLFGGKKHLHHFVAEQDVAKELFALLVEAKTMYLRDVVTGNKLKEMIKDVQNKRNAK